MVFFNLIYQGYTQDHQRILKIGLGAYLGVVAVLFSGKLPENVLESRAVEFFKSYGWLLVLIDYLVLNLLHYFQTGQYLFRQNTQAQYQRPTRPHYVAWQSPESNYLEDNDDGEDPDEFEEDLEDQPHGLRTANCEAVDPEVDDEPEESSPRNPGAQMQPSGARSPQPQIQTSGARSPQPQTQPSGARSPQPQTQPVTQAQPFVPRPELLIPVGLQTGGAPVAPQVANQVAQQVRQETNVPPFDPNYTIDDDQNASMGDDQEYFEDNQEPQIIDNYAMNRSNHHADESESISD